MNRPITTAALLALATLVHRPVHARVIPWDAAAPREVAALGDARSGDSPVTQLRSAYVLRDNQLDCRAFPPDAASRRLQLQRHFDVVLAALVENFDRGVDVALARLERARGETWSAAKRSAVRRILAERRLVNMQRLRLYQLRSVFPQNEHVADRAVPVFVDNYDTACAVGHLMRESGWTDAVAAIQRANNLVYVPDVHAGPLVDWVLISGLTQEEAALIQPSYYPPLFDAKFDALTQGGSLTRNGLYFDNFQFMGGELTDPDSFPEVPPPANQLDLAGYGAAVRRGVFGGGFSQVIDAIHHDWLFTGAVSEEYSIYSADKPWGLLISYDVEPIDANERFVAASVESFAANYNFLLGGGVLEIETNIYAGEASDPPLTTLTLTDDTNPGSFFESKDSETFAPQRTLSVVTSVKLVGEAAFTSLVHSFERTPGTTSDFDSDGDVDGKDFLAWQRGLGAENATLAQGDANRDGATDAADLQAWKVQAVSATHSASVPAPEPSAAVLATMIAALLLSRRR